MPKTYEEYGIIGVPGGHGEYRVTCPECAHNRKGAHRNEKDLSVNRDKQTWHCHHCEWAGGLGTESSNGYGTMPKVFIRPRGITQVKTMQDKVYEYLASRGISREIVDQERVIAAKSWCPACEKERDAIAFPYYRQDAHINTTYIHRVTGDDGAMDKHVWQEKGAERILWGLDTIADATEIIICEGQIDRLSFLQAGFPHVLSVPDGAPSPTTSAADSKFRYLESASALLADKQIILAGDNDPAGQAMNAELSRRLGRERCRQIRWPAYLNDANEALVKIGPAMLAECVERAAPYPIEGLFWAEDTDAETDLLFDRGFDPGLRLGYSALDDHYRIRPGLLSVVTGIPSHGKSLWLDHIVVKLIKNHGWNVGYFSPENQPFARHRANMIEILAGKPFDIGRAGRMERWEYERERDYLHGRVAFIAPPRYDLDSILAKARAAIMQRGLNGLVIDPYNYLENSRPNNKTETEFISDILGQLKAFAQAHDVHVWLLAHPTKISAPTPETAPTLNDISGSAHFRNKADYGLSIWRDPGNVGIPAQVHIEKVRFSETGKPGRIRYRFDVETRQIEEVAE